MTQVTAYAKNDHLGFQIYYLWNGAAGASCRTSSSA